MINKNIILIFLSVILLGISSACTRESGGTSPGGAGSGFESQPVPRSEVGGGFENQPVPRSEAGDRIRKSVREQQQRCLDRGFRC